MWAIRALAFAWALAAVTGAGLKGKWVRTKLEGQGYSGVVVAISPSVPETEAGQLIPAIKTALTEASESLFTATRHQLYFKDIKILIPRSWTGVPVDQPASTERLEDAEIRVGLVDTIYKNQPNTKQTRQCGEPGEYMFLSNDYLIDDSIASPYGPRGKVITFEWARLRWGVFDEMGYPDDPLYPLFYQRNDGEGLRVVPNYCADQTIAGSFVDQNTHGPCTYEGELPDENCRFVPDATQTATSSLLSFTYINSIEHFCDSANNGEVHKHDDRAPTRQNTMCLRRSAWEVMQEHADFFNTTELPSDWSVTPEFTVVQEVEAKFTLVLDHSSSMFDYDRMGKMQRSAKRWILHDVAEGSSVALVHFGNDAVLKYPMTEITDEGTRQAIADAVTTESLGGTCIGCGLQLAVQETDGLSNKVIILITDGMENVSPYIEDVMDDVVESGTRVVTIAYGLSSQETLESLAQNTGGKTYFVSDEDDGSMLDDAFEGSLTYQPGDSLTNTDIKIYDYQHDVELETSLLDTFIVDATVGRNLHLRVDTKTPDVVTDEPILTSPTGDTFTASDFDSDTGLWIINVDLAEEGTWSWSLGLALTANGSHFRVTATAQARDPDVMPIYTEAWISTGTEYVDASTERVIVYAKVTQGDKPVVGAAVKAFITDANTTEEGIELWLYDNGQDPDMQAGDGVYSAYFTEYTVTGRYSVKAQVWDDGSAYINNGFIVSRRPALPPYLSSLLDIPTYCCGSVVPFDPELATPTGEFTRTAAAGSFHVIKLPASGDTFPPARVLDLTAAKSGENSLTLVWTAPGEDLDKGKVFCYEIKISQELDALYDDQFDSSTDNAILLSCTESQDLDNLLVEAGRKVTYTFEVAMEDGELYYVALKALDDDSNESLVSNVALAM